MSPGQVLTLTAFLSTPSGWRATSALSLWICPRSNFYPRPPGGGRHTHFLRGDGFVLISIHALRVEGDMPSIGRVIR